jgi:Nif-specific regulatory protein
MNQERSLPHLLELIAAEAARLLRAERATIFLHDAERQELWSRVALGSDEVLRFPADRGIAGYSLASAETVVVNDVRKDARFFSAIDERTGFRTRSLIATPLSTRNNPRLGVFEVLNKRRANFDDADAEVLQAISAQAAIALENASMFETMERERAELARDNDLLRKEVSGTFATQNILGRSGPVRAIHAVLAQIEGSSVNVLITGESGTGKELIAKAVHYGSARSGKPLVAVNCASIPDSLLESEMFGIDRGTATGVDARIGRFEQADGGSLFLDELGDLSLPAQAKLLRVLQERQLERVGGRTAIPIDVRIIAATNKDLEVEIAAGRFRADLYYRIKVIHIRTPALREIREDVPLLAQYFLDQACDEQKRARKRLSSEALACLISHDWPGNIRELQNEMLRVAIAAPQRLIRETDLSLASDTPGKKPRSVRSLRDALDQTEREWIERAYRACDGNQLRTAKTLGLSRQGLLNKLRRYGLH